MFFGLCNSPATMMRMMNTNYQDLIAEGWLLIYMDDLLVMAPDSTTLWSRLRRLLDRSREIDVYFKPEKCIFNVTEVEFCGTIIKNGTIQMDPAKLSGISDWKQPTTVKEVRSFLGFANFYRKFIAVYSHIAKPLHNLTKRDQKWEWSDECEHQ